jgi:hypothetical protein
MVALRLVAVPHGGVHGPASPCGHLSYEAVGISGQNNVVDSNASQCDSVEGCYTRRRCVPPIRTCDLQAVPAGRCSYGDLSTGLLSCVFPHRAGHCSGNAKIGCLTNDQCTAAGGTCLLTTDKYGAAYESTACNCTNATAQAVCGGSISCGRRRYARPRQRRRPGRRAEDRRSAADASGMGLRTPGRHPAPAYGSRIRRSFDPQSDAAASPAATSRHGPDPPRATDAREITAYVHLHDRQSVPSR